MTFKLLKKICFCKKIDLCTTFQHLLNGAIFFEKVMNTYDPGFDFHMHLKEAWHSYTCIFLDIPLTH